MGIEPHLQIQKLLSNSVSIHQSGDLARAKSGYRRILQLNPNTPEVHHLLGLLYQQQNIIKKALLHHRKAVFLNNKEIRYSKKLADVLWESNFHQEAIRCLSNTIENNTVDDDAHLKLAYYYLEFGEKEVAEKHFNQSWYLNESNWKALLGVIQILFQRNEFEDVITKFNTIKTVDAGEQELYSITLIVAKSYAAINDLLTAEELFIRLCAIQKDSADMLNGYGTLLVKKGLFLEAKEKFVQALNFEPDYENALFNLAVSGIYLKEHENAISHLDKLLKINENYHKARAPLLHMLRQCCYWKRAKEQSKIVRSLLDKSLLDIKQDDAYIEIAPFSIITMEDNRYLDEIKVSKNWYNTHVYKKKIKPVSINRKVNRRIKIGYLSADFHEHATAYLLIRVLELHDREKFEIYGYSYGVNDRSEMRNRIEKGIECFFDVSNLTDINIAKKIAEDGIDILVDLKGFTQNTRSKLLAYRPAAIQINFLGYPSVMGQNLVDYRISDSYLASSKDNAESLKIIKEFSERDLLLPNCYQPNDDSRFIGDLPERLTLGLPEDKFVFGAFHQSYKITENMLLCWCIILLNTKNSVLWLLSTNESAKKNILSFCMEQQIKPERIIFADKCDAKEHITRIQQVDLMLDTFPVNGHTSTSDALWAKVPVLTISGNTFISRVAGSLLHTMSLEELICTDEKDYVSCAISIANSSDDYIHLKNKVAIQRDESPLFDSQQYVRNLESLFVRVFDESVNKKV